MLSFFMFLIIFFKNFSFRQFLGLSSLIFKKKHDLNVQNYASFILTGSHKTSCPSWRIKKLSRMCCSTLCPAGMKETTLSTSDCSPSRSKFTYQTWSWSTSSTCLFSTSGWNPQGVFIFALFLKKKHTQHRILIFCNPSNKSKNTFIMWFWSAGHTWIWIVSRS